LIQFVVEPSGAPRTAPVLAFPDMVLLRKYDGETATKMITQKLSMPRPSLPAFLLDKQRVGATLGKAGRSSRKRI
jgi:hypothetical protein